MTVEERLRSALQDPVRTPSLDFTERVIAALPSQRRASPWSPRWSIAPIGAAAVLAVVLVVGSSIAEPNGVGPLPTSVDPSASASAAASTATAPATVETYADGIPREIDGEPVLRGDAIRIEAAQRTDDSPFLIGGYVVLSIADCLIDPIAPNSPLLAPCGDGYHLRDWSGDHRGARFVVGASFEGPLGGEGPIVLRVHVHDERAAACDADIRLTCEHTIVAEAGVWTGPGVHPMSADGLPSEVDGQPVLRGDAIAPHIAAASDDRSFLIGGWATDLIAYRCLATRPEDPPPPALLPCGAPAFLLVDAPDRPDGHVVVALPPVSRPVPGRVVLRVHVHHVLAGRCEPAARATCETRMVLEAVLWTEPIPANAPSPGS